MADVVITGIGLVTPLGRSPEEVLARIAAGEVAAEPSLLGSALACPSVARVGDFDAQRYFPENKTLRLMNRDAEMAVVAARLAIEDAGVALGRT
jgi:3-oxoacyl-(acyl-carrier-protein) synthase